MITPSSKWTVSHCISHYFLYLFVFGCFCCGAFTCGFWWLLIRDEKDVFFFTDFGELISNGVSTLLKFDARFCICVCVWFDLLIIENCSNGVSIILFEVWFCFKLYREMSSNGSYFWSLMLYYVYNIILCVCNLIIIQN